MSTFISQGEEPAARERKIIQDTERITARINPRGGKWGQNQEHMLGQLWGRGGGYSSLECGEGKHHQNESGGCEVGEK